MTEQEAIAAIKALGATDVRFGYEERRLEMFNPGVAVSLRDNGRPHRNAFRIERGNEAIARRMLVEWASEGFASGWSHAN